MSEYKDQRGGCYEIIKSWGEFDLNHYQGLLDEHEDVQVVYEILEKEIIDKYSELYGSDSLDYLDHGELQYDSLRIFQARFAALGEKNRKIVKRKIKIQVLEEITRTLEKKEKKK